MSFYGKRSVIFGLLILSCAVSQNETVTITFDELTELATRHSPSVQIIENTYSLTNAGKNIDLQWTNLGFNYSREFADEQLEQYLTLDKQIELPWVYAERRKGWEAQIEAAAYKKEAQTRQFLSDLKTGYCELRLLETQLTHLHQLKDAILELSDVARDQFREGSLSGIEQHLIQMTLININARLRETEQTTQSVRNRWKANLGIGVAADIQLATDIDFQPVALKTMDQYLSAIPGLPGYRQRERVQQALESNIKMERKRLIPHISLFGGSKQVEQSRGFILGLSFPLPVLNRNQAVIQQQKVKLQLATSEFEQYRQHLKAQIKTTVLTIEDLKAWLEKVETSLNDDRTVITSLMAAYREGWMSLTEFLNAIQILADGDQQYYKQLTIYYRSIFQLEAITGQTLVTFSER